MANKFIQFWKNLWNGLKNFVLSFKVINKEQYEKLVEEVLSHQNEVWEYLDANKDNYIQCSEILNGIKKAIKKEN